MKNDSKIYYDQTYFNWQASIGEFGGWANAPKFEKFIKKSDVVLDFGCGGGWLLKRLPGVKKLGIEINPAALKVAQGNGIEAYPSAKNIQDNSVNIIISNHALEHTHNPLGELKTLKTKLCVAGKAVFVVPCESVFNQYKSGDVNRHLYTWNPMCLGNLFTEAGYSVLESKPLWHSWPPQYQLIAKVGGRKLFDLTCWAYALLRFSYSQVRIVATVN
jgi:SAM-dependent methyltransferase